MHHQGAGHLSDPQDPKEVQSLSQLDQEYETLCASKPIPAGSIDENSNTITVWTKPVHTYLDILQVTLVGSCKQYLDHLLNDVMQCATNILMATYQAVHSGTLHWSNPNYPQSFSLFACPYLGAISNNVCRDQEPP